MASRRYKPYEYERRPVQPSVVIQHSRLPAGYHLAGRSSPELLQNKLAHQAAEIDKLVAENKKLAESHVVMRQDLDAAQLRIRKRKEDIRVIEEESDMQIRALLDRIGKIETDIKDGERIKRELQEAKSEARSLVAINQDLALNIRDASHELEKAQSDMKKLSEMNAELDILSRENRRLQKIFELEKHANLEKVQQMQMMEKDLVDLAKEVKRLRAMVVNSKRLSHAPNLPNGVFVIQDPLNPPNLHGRTIYVDQNSRQSYKLGNEAAIERRVVRVNGISAIVPGAGSSSLGGAYETKHIRR